MATTSYSDIKRKLKIFEVYFFILSFLLVVSLSMLFYLLSLEGETKIKYVPVIKYVSEEREKYEYNTSILGYSYIKIPAVMENSSYAYVVAEMYVFPGKGNIFINIKDTLIDDDTQQSIRKAIKYAVQHEGKRLNDYDFTVVISSNAALLTGPSAGATFAVLSIAALRNKIPSQDIMMTGTLGKDGTIGLSGKILDKARAAKNAGATTFLVPRGLGVVYDVKEREECDIYGDKQYCDIIEYAQIINISEEVGMNVIEVGTVEEALEYFNI